MKKLLFLILFSFFLNSSAISQLDSISVNAYFETTTGQIEGLDSPINVKLIKTETWINDFDFFGEIVVEFKEISTGYITYIAKKTKQQILDESLMTDNVIHISGYNIEEQRSYIIRFIIRDYQGNNLFEPEFTLTH